MLQEGGEHLINGSDSEWSLCQVYKGKKRMLALPLTVLLTGKQLSHKKKKGPPFPTILQIKISEELCYTKVT